VVLPFRLLVEKYSAIPGQADDTLLAGLPARGASAPPVPHSDPRLQVWNWPHGLDALLPDL